MLPWKVLKHFCLVKRRAKALYQMKANERKRTRNKTETNLSQPNNQNETGKLLLFVNIFKINVIHRFYI